MRKAELRRITAETDIFLNLDLDGNGNSAVIIISDDGPGIPDDVKPHIFEMFFTGRNKVADGRRGLGLGLTLCKSIVEAHHGSITLKDNEPSGCCFTISLPMREVQVNE